MGGDNGGDASLQNALELARESLQLTPSFTSREVVLMCASLSSCDPGDILATISALRRDKVRACIFSLLAEVFICRKVASDTGGDFAVPTSAAHLRDLLLQLVPPRPLSAAPNAAAAPSNSLVRVGFPKREKTNAPTLGFTPGGGVTPTMVLAPYRCPQCSAAHTELPTECPVCALKLMSSVELTKTYHHLFPIANFTESVEAQPADPASADPPDLRQSRIDCCFGCAEPLIAAAPSRAAAIGAAAATIGVACPACGRRFCAACDELVHSVLRTCPGCELNGGG